MGGFLGCGKTTLILRLARSLVTKRGLKVAIVENEIGEIGVDGKVMKKYGLSTKEIFGGCICCQLGSSLIETLNALRKGFNPDVVVLEPTGIANPESIKNTLKYARSTEGLPAVVLVDPLRFTKILEELDLIITSQVTSADILAINKIDASNEEELRSVEGRLRKLNKGATIVRVSAKTGQNVEKLEEQIFRETGSD